MTIDLTSGSPTRRIRKLVARDIEPLQRLDAQAHGAAWSHRTFVDEVESNDRTHLVAEASGAVVGHAAAWIDGPTCRISNVAVDQAHRGCGHASALLAAVLRSTIDHAGVRNVQLEVRPSSRGAQRLYNRFGFMPVGIERDFYDRRDKTGSTDALVMAVPDVCNDAWRTRLADIESTTPALGGIQDSDMQPGRPRTDPKDQLDHAKASV